MAKANCKRRGNGIGDTAKSCPKCGVIARPVASRVAWSWLVGIILVATSCGVLLTARDIRSSPSSPSDQITYQIAQEWSIPNGGFGRVIVVDPKYRNEKDMRTLANRLKLDTARDRNAFVFIYDDAVAASRRLAAI